MTVFTSQRFWRYRIFALTWCVYAGFYLCRKNLSVIMPSLKEDLGYTTDDLANILFGYLTIYAIGQFSNGFLSDRFGPRLIVGLGLIVAVISNVFMGIAASSLALFGLLYVANGYAQSTGWSGTIKNMSTWFHHEERGVVMAWWSTCYALGGAAATAFATWVAFDAPFFEDVGWRRGFYVPAAALSVVTVCYILFVRNRPSDVGFEDHQEPTPGSDKDGKEENVFAIWKAVLSSKALWTTGIMYFFLKMTRYAFLFWLPLYMVESAGYAENEAGYTSLVFELAGFGGVLIAGYASEKLMDSRRFPVASIMLFGLAGSCFIYPSLAEQQGWLNIVGLSLIGIMTFGPDALMTGAGAMDIGSQKAAGMAAGIINGIGSIGAALSPLLVAKVTDSRLGWDGLFPIFMIFSVIAALLMATRWNEGKVPPEQSV
jgi:sugar phosphate permease